MRDFALLAQLTAAQAAIGAPVPNQSRWSIEDIKPEALPELKVNNGHWPGPESLKIDAKTYAKDPAFKSIKAIKDDKGEIRAVLIDDGHSRDRLYVTEKNFELMATNEGIRIPALGENDGLIKLRTEKTKLGANRELVIYSGKNGVNLDMSQHTNESKYAFEFTLYGGGQLTYGKDTVDTYGTIFDSKSNQALRIPTTLAIHSNVAARAEITHSQPADSPRSEGGSPGRHLLSMGNNKIHMVPPNPHSVYEPERTDKTTDEEYAKQVKRHEEESKEFKDAMRAYNIKAEIFSPIPGKKDPVKSGVGLYTEGNAIGFMAEELKSTAETVNKKAAKETTQNQGQSQEK